MYDIEEKSLKKINLAVGNQQKEVEKSIKIVIRKPFSEILPNER